MIKRKKLKELKAQLHNKEITLLAGARQAGKTTLLRLLEDELKQSGQKSSSEHFIEGLNGPFIFVTRR